MYQLLIKQVKIMKAKLLRETEKAVLIQGKVEIRYNTWVEVTIWMPKSKISVYGVKNGILSFGIENYRFFDMKVRDYFYTTNVNYPPEIKSDIEMFIENYYWQCQDIKI